MRPEEMIAAVVGLVVVAYMFRSIIGLFERRIEARARPAFSPESDQRLVRLEQAVDAIAVEVERIAEGQRFTTRLLSDRVPAPPIPTNKPPVQS
jgi:hypothetical protein